MNSSKYAITIPLFALFFIAELIVGLISNSLALQADAFHLLSDILSLCIGYVAQSHTQRVPTDEYTYGWLRSPIIGSVINTTFLLSICFSLTINIIQRFIEGPSLIQYPEYVLGVGIGGLVANGIGMMLFHSHAESEGSHNDHGVCLHLLGDLLGSIIVVINALIVMYTKQSPFIRYIDPLASALLVVIIAFSSIKLLRKSIRILLHQAPHSLQHLSSKIEELQEVNNVHHFHIFSLDENTTVATLHVDVSEQSKDIIIRINEVLHTCGIHNSIIQLENEGKCYDCIDENCTLNKCCGKSNVSVDSNP